MFRFTVFWEFLKLTPRIWKMLVHILKCRTCRLAFDLENRRYCTEGAVLWAGMDE